MEIVCGTYEKFILGFRASIETAKLQPVFGYAAHDGCVKSVAAAGRILVSGSTDEIIKIYDLKRKKEVGNLVQHDGPVTTLAFFRNTHLLSGSEDSTICVWKVKEWTCLRTLKGHKGAINCVAVHPTGKLALTSSRDKSVRLWDLTNGNCAATTPRTSEPDVVAWSQNGKMYAVSENTEVTIQPLEDPEKVVRLHHEKKVHSLTFASDNVLVTGGEDRVIKVWDARSGSCSGTSGAHQNRIRGVVLLPGDSDSDSDGARLVGTASSDGLVRVWDLRALAKPVVDHQTARRLTCIAATNVPSGPDETLSSSPTPKALARKSESNDESSHEHAAEAAAPVAKKPSKRTKRSA
mmetsp:Transcript_6896/g.11861  ORF Transcript_6896/g.11861 Transcript_6896/m.11861 type:complete len:350 (-) Transcript_6896:162-1211(-)